MKPFLIIWFTGLCTLCAAQVFDGFQVEADTLPEVEYYAGQTERVNIFAGRPGKAALYSLILPGAGQFYNKKYLHVPIVWAGVGVAGGIMIYNIDQYNTARDAYRERLLAEIEGRPPVDDFSQFSTAQIRNIRDRANRYRQVSIFAFSLVWVANAAQAFVSAHLIDFDISEDLSLHIEPASLEGLAGTGMLQASVVVRF